MSKLQAFATCGAVLTSATSITIENDPNNNLAVETSAQSFLNRHPDKVIQKRNSGKVNTATFDKFNSVFNPEVDGMEQGKTPGLNNNVESCTQICMERMVHKNRCELTHGSDMVKLVSTPGEESMHYTFSTKKKGGDWTEKWSDEASFFPDGTRNIWRDTDRCQEFLCKKFFKFEGEKFFAEKLADGFFRRV